MANLFRRRVLPATTDQALDLLVRKVWVVHRSLRGCGVMHGAPGVALRHPRRDAAAGFHRVSHAALVVRHRVAGRVAHPARFGPRVDVRTEEGERPVPERLPLLEASVLLPSKQGDGRSMFAIPWGRQTILGTTDTPYDGALDGLALTREDLDYVLAAGNAVFKKNLAEQDVLGAWAGVRPLIRQLGTGSMSDISRRHSLVEGQHGMLTITGGKLTTYRRMAKDVVDRIAAKDGKKTRCRTDEIPLSGTRPVAELVAETTVAAARVGLSEEVAVSLVRQCGETASHVLSLVAADPTLGELLSPTTPHIAAEVVHAARSEGASTLDDVFSRRTRLSLRAKDAAMPSALLAARLLARETHQDDDWAMAQVSAYADAVRQERGVLGLIVDDALPAVS